jgi:tripartite-type tricarboxylate transporter receptor subunit TctC
MPTSRRALLGAALLPLPAFAQGSTPGVFPDRPIRLIMPFPAGGSSDTHARAFADAMSRELPQRIVVDNRSGAGGNIGVDAAAKSPADGYTLLATGPNIINTRYLIRDTPFRWERDFDPLGMMFSAPNVLVVHPSVPARTVPEFIAHVRANPGRLNFGSAGAGGSIHLSAEMFMEMTGTRMTHVPYRGDALLRADLTNGTIQVLFGGITTALEPMRAGQWRGLGVTGLQRWPAVPDLLQRDELDGPVRAEGRTGARGRAAAGRLRQGDGKCAEPRGVRAPGRAGDTEHGRRASGLHAE